MAALEALQEWYARACDGDWEHSFGIKIDTVDNPGWIVSIDIMGTPIEGRVLDVAEDFAGGEWLRIACDGSVFRIACGPRSLDRGITAFLEFSGQEIA